MKVEEAKGEDEEERESERRGREGRTLLLVECVKREREALGASENGKHSDILSIRHTMFIYFFFLHFSFFSYSFLLHNLRVYCFLSCTFSNFLRSLLSSCLLYLPFICFLS